MKDVKLEGQDRNQLKSGIFYGLSLDIQSQTKVALIVPSHMKSIIANILTRAIDTESGSVKIDGLNLKDYSLKTLRSQIYHVAIDSIIINASIKDNIALSCQNASDLQIYRAALQAQLLNFIDDFSENVRKIKEDLKRVI